MNITQFMEKENINQSQFARLVDMSKQLISYHLTNPDAPWTLDKAMKIINATGYEITIKDLMGE